MTQHRLFLGVDGGGTKTEFVCMEADGKVVACAVTGTSYHLQVGLDGAGEALGQGVKAICDHLSIRPADLAFAFFGLPAYGEDALVDPRLHDRCGRLLGHDRYVCGNDMICGWAGSFACADGINLVAGTGSIGYGEHAGRAARAGGWGEVFGDEGSAYWIAIEGLNAFTRMSDGRVPVGPLHRLFTEALGLHEDIEICARIMGGRGMGRDEIAGLARIVSHAASEGDATASAILERAADELCALAVTLRERLAFDPAALVPLSWSGGVLTNEPLVRGSFGARIEAVGGFRLTTPLHPPGYGAALYARHLSDGLGARTGPAPVGG